MSIEVPDDNIRLSSTHQLVEDAAFLMFTHHCFFLVNIMTTHGQPTPKRG